MAGLPTASGEQVVKAFEGAGRKVARQAGSHIILIKPGQPITLSVPNHREVARGTLRSLIASAGLTVEEFTRLIK